jgi:predicted nucleic acid-binding protein
MICEYRDVVLRPEHIAASSLSTVQLEQLIAALETVATRVEIERSYRPLSHDPDDDLVLELAINGAADAIVTGNLRHLREPASRFGIAVMDASGFIMMLREAGLL